MFGGSQRLNYAPPTTYVILQPVRPNKTGRIDWPGQGGGHAEVEVALANHSSRPV